MTQSIAYPYAFTGAPFFTVAELGAQMQMTLDPADPTAVLLQTLASDAVREDLQQTVDVIENDTVTLYGDGGDLLILPERPVIAVSSVILDGQTLNPVTSQPYIAGSDVPLYDWRPNGNLERVVYPGSYYAGQRNWAWPNSVQVTVTYDHGYAVVPTAFKRVALQAAAGAYTNPDLASVTTVGRTRTEPGWVGLTLTPAQSSALDYYRRPDA